MRSERKLSEQLDYNLMFRWFVGLELDTPIWDRTVFSINRDRLLSTDLTREFFQRMLYLAEWQGFVSDEHFSVDGTMIEAWASHKSFQPKDGSGVRPTPPCSNSSMDLKGKKRGNAMHKSSIDSQARLYKKGEFTEAKLRNMTHVLSENRHGLIVDVQTTQADGCAEWQAAQIMIARSVRRAGVSIGADKGYDTQELVDFLQKRRFKAQIVRKDVGSAVDGRSARGSCYATSLRRRKMV